MIIFVMLMKISLARHEVYKEMELVLKKVSQLESLDPWFDVRYRNFIILGQL